MPERSTITIHVNGHTVVMPAGSVVSAALLAVGESCRMSVSGEPRTAFCGMGICFECRAVIDGVAHQRTCQMLCREGMSVETQR